MARSEYVQQLDRQIAAAVERLLQGLREQLGGRLKQTTDDLLRQLESSLPEVPASFLRDDDVAPLTAAARAEGRSQGLSELADAVARLDRADSQAAVLRSLLDSTAAFASRAALFLTRPEGARGWGGFGFGEFNQPFSDLEIRYDDDQPWRKLAAGRGVVPLAAADCARLCSRLESSLPHEGALVPLVLRDRVAAVVYADRLTAGSRFDLEALQLLVYAAAQAIEVLPFRERHATPTLRLAEEAATEPGLGLWQPEEIAPAAPVVEPTAAIAEPSAAAGFAIPAPPVLAPAAPVVAPPPVVAPVPTRVEPIPEPAPAAEPESSFEIAPVEPSVSIAEDVTWAPPPAPARPEAPPAEESAEIWTLEEEPVPAPPAPSPGRPSFQDEPTQLEWERPAGLPTAPAAPAEPERPAPLPELVAPPLPPAVAPEAATAALDVTEDQTMLLQRPRFTEPLSPATREIPAQEAEEETRPPQLVPPAPARPTWQPGTTAEVAPPPDVQGPGWAFATTRMPAFAPAAPEDSAHEEARRLARLLVSEIKLYNEEQVEEGRRSRDVYERLKDDIDRSRQMYEERVEERVRNQTDYFYQELVRILAGGDPKALGI